MAWPADMQCRRERHRASPQAACEPQDWPPNPNPNAPSPPAPPFPLSLPPSLPALPLPPSCLPLSLLRSLPSPPLTGPDPATDSLAEEVEGLARKILRTLPWLFFNLSGTDWPEVVLVCYGALCVGCFVLNGYTAWLLGRQLSTGTCGHWRDCRLCDLLAALAWFCGPFILGGPLLGLLVCAPPYLWLVVVACRVLRLRGRRRTQGPQTLAGAAVVGPEDSDTPSLVSLASGPNGDPIVHPRDPDAEHLPARDRPPTPFELDIMDSAPSAASLYSERVGRASPDLDGSPLVRLHSGLECCICLEPFKDEVPPLPPSTTLKWGAPQALVTLFHPPPVMHPFTSLYLQKLVISVCFWTCRAAKKLTISVCFRTSRTLGGAVQNALHFVLPDAPRAVSLGVGAGTGLMNCPTPENWV